MIWTLMRPVAAMFPVLKCANAPAEKTRRSTGYVLIESYPGPEMCQS